MWIPLQILKNPRGTQGFASPLPHLEIFLVELSCINNSSMVIRFVISMCIHSYQAVAAPEARAGKKIVKWVSIYSLHVIERLSKHALFWRRWQALMLNSSFLFPILLTTECFPSKRLKAEWTIEKQEKIEQHGGIKEQWGKPNLVNCKIFTTLTELGFQPQRLSFLQNNKISSPISD